MANSKMDFQSKSYLKHRQQRAWQILLPIWIGVVVILVGVVMVVLTAVGEAPGGVVSAGADTSFIWLSLPVLFFALVFGLILFGLIYLMAKLLNILPVYTHLGQQYADLMAAQVKYWANLAVKPILATASFLAKVSALFHGVFGHPKQ